MSKLSSKSAAFAGAFGALTSGLVYLIKPTRITLGLLILVGAITAFSHLMSTFKNTYWTQVEWIWTSFFLPILVGQMLLIDWLIQFFVVKWIIVILLVYFTLLPLALAFGCVYLGYVCQQL